MSEEKKNTELQKLALEAIEKEIERVEKERGKMTEEEKEKFRQNNLSKFLYTVKLKNFVETEYVPNDLKYDLEG